MTERGSMIPSKMGTVVLAGPNSRVALRLAAWLTHYSFVNSGMLCCSSLRGKASPRKEESPVTGAPSLSCHGHGQAFFGSDHMIMVVIA